MTTGTPPTIEVDFNRADDDDIVWAPRAKAPYAQPGQLVVLVDADGSRCLGVVERVDAKRVYVRADLSTWQDAEPVTVTNADETLDEVLRSRARLVIGPPPLTVGVNEDE